MEIELTQGQVALIDEADADLTQWNWQAFYRNGFWYITGPGHLMGHHQKRVGLGRVIMERIMGRPLKPYEQVRYIDGDPLNNTRSNLTLAGRAWKHESEATA